MDKRKENFEETKFSRQNLFPPIVKANIKGPGKKEVSYSGGGGIWMFYTFLSVELEYVMKKVFFLPRSLEPNTRKTKKHLAIFSKKKKSLVLFLLNLARKHIFFFSAFFIKNTFFNIFFSLIYGCATHFWKHCCP